MHDDNQHARRFLIGDLILDEGRHQVSRGGKILDLPGLSYQLIIVLAEAAPNVVSHDELVSRVWPGKVISPETITQRIKLARQAIGDDARNPRYIGLVRGEGYRMLADVEPLPPEETTRTRSLLSELGRRRVLQTALIYAAVAWSVTEILSFLLDALPVFPEWSEALVAIIFIVGLPVAMLLAWRFDIGPGGIRRTQAAAAKDRITIASALFLLVGATAGLFYLIYPRVWEQVESARMQQLALAEAVDAYEANTSIAVLPFSDLSPNQDQAYFSDGITEQLLNELAQLEGLNVTGRNSSFAFKSHDQDLRSIGKRLGVTNILEGSVRKDGDDLRINAQLINAQTGFQLWSKTYDRQMTDIFDIQEDIARECAGALSIALGVDGRNRLPGTGTDSVEAYDLFLEARGAESFEMAKALYERAIELDPDYAEAWAELGAAYGSLLSWQLPPDEARAAQEHGRELVVRATEIDPDLASAYDYLSGFQWARGDWIGATEYHRAYSALAPADIPARIGSVNILAKTGRTRDALLIGEFSRQTDPLNFFATTIRAELNIQAGRYDDAEAEIARLVTMTSDAEQSVQLRRMLMAITKGDHESIRESLQNYGEADPRASDLVSAVLEKFDSPAVDVSAMLHRLYNGEKKLTGEGRLLIASVAAHFGHPELALELMAEELRSNLVRASRIWYPFFSEMRKLPDFKVLAADIGFVPYWRKYGWADTCRPVGKADFVCE